MFLTDGGIVGDATAGQSAGRPEFLGHDIAGYFHGFLVRVLEHGCIPSGHHFTNFRRLLGEQDVTELQIAFDLQADLVTGPVTNTSAGIELVEKLTGVPALNLLDRASLPSLRDLLNNALAT